MNPKGELDHSKYLPIIEQMIRNSTGAPVVTEKNVYQEGNPANKPLMRQIVADLLKPGSRIDGLEHLVELHGVAKRKKACLILMEHYSNFDIPCVYELLESSGEDGNRVAEAIVSVAGVKLNEESKLVLAFTEIFTRVVLFPARSLESIKDPKERREAERRRGKINIAALKALYRLRGEGRIILVFPSGTRYRPWDPSTGKGLKEIDTYLKFYSHMVLIAINGNTLLPNRTGTMEEDFIQRDLVMFTVSPVMKCSEFRKQALRGREDHADPKQAVADGVMAALGRIHEETEKKRQALLTAGEER